MSRRVEPIHATELKRFLSCRLAWFWSAYKPRGLQLERKVPQQALQLGTTIHAALEEHYQKGTAPSIAFTRLALEEQNRLEEEYGRLWPEQLEALKKDGELGLDMMRGYEDWTVNEQFKVLDTESSWTVPVHPGLTLAGRFDMLIEDDTGLWVMDFKTTKSANVHSCKWTAMDLQASIYVWAARKLFGSDVQGIIFRFLRKKAPDTWEKMILKSGKLTTRKGLLTSTTLAQYDKTLAILAMRLGDKLAEEDVHHPMYYALRLEEGYLPSEETLNHVKKEYWSTRQAIRGADNPFFWDVRERRSQAELANYFKFVVMPAAREMNATTERWVGPTGLGAAYFLCPSCPFKNACAARMANGDYKSILEEDFQERVL